MEEMNALLFPLFKKNIFSNKPNAIGNFGFAADQIQTLIHNEMEGQLDTGKMMNALWQYSQQLGVKIITGALVQAIEENPQEVAIHTQEMDFYAQQIFHLHQCIHQKIIAEYRIKSGRGQVIATAPIPNLKVKGIFFFDDGFYYFKDFENRIIFGGGRNLDFEGENTTEFGSNQVILDKLNHYLRTIILPQTDFTIEHQWSGIMAFGSNKLPLVQK